MESLPVVASPLEVLVSFLPGQWRLIRRGGIELWTLRYWHPDLDPFVGCDEPQLVSYDPRDISKVYVRGPEGRLRECELLTPVAWRMSLPEWRRMRKLDLTEGTDAEDLEAKDRGVAEKDKVVNRSKKATAAAHRMAAREEERRKTGQHITGIPEEPEPEFPPGQLSDGPLGELPIEPLD